MPGTDGTCKSKATVEIGRHHEADVECGLEENHDEKNHIASQIATGRDEKTGKAIEATIIFTWK